MESFCKSEVSYLLRTLKAGIKNIIEITSIKEVSIDFSQAYN